MYSAVPQSLRPRSCSAAHEQARPCSANHSHPEDSTSRLCISSWCLRPGPLTELWVLSNLHWTHYTANGAVAIFSHFMAVWPTNQVFILFYITLKKAIKKKQSSLITYPLLILALLIPHGYKQCITVNTSHCISMICNCLLS